MDPRRKRHAGGRPKLPPHELRSHEISIYVNDEELSRINHRAARLGIKPAVMLRTEGVGKALPAPPAGRAFDAQALMQLSSLWTQASAIRRELRAIGVNLNQVAHAANAGRFMASKAELTMKDVSERTRQLKRLCEHAEAALEAMDKADESEGLSEEAVI